MAVENINGISSYQAQQSYMMNQNNTGNQIKAVEETGKDAGTKAESESHDLQRTVTDFAETVQEATAENREEMKAQENELSSMHDKIKKSIADYSSKMGNYEAQFGIHEATNRVTIKLVDKDTKKVIKELPPEKTLDMIAKCMEIAGILVDQKI